jgi:hypothetical protein
LLLLPSRLRPVATTTSTWGGVLLVVLLLVVLGGRVVGARSIQVATVGGRVESGATSTSLLLGRVAGEGHFSTLLLLLLLL